MATVKVKRKKSTGNENITLKAGEPYYNLADKTLFVGSSDGEAVNEKKHLAQVTAETTDDNVVKFYVGENSSNTYTKTINNVEQANRAAHATTATNVDNGYVRLNNMYYGTDDPDIEDAEVGTIYIKIQS